MTTPLDAREAEVNEPPRDLPVESEHHTRYGRGTLRLLAPVLSRRNRFGIWAGVVLAVVAMGLLGLVPLIQQVILDDAILADRRSLPCGCASCWASAWPVLWRATFAAVGGGAAVRVQRDLQ